MGKQRQGLPYTGVGMPWESIFGIAGAPVNVDYSQMSPDSAEVFKEYAILFGVPLAVDRDVEILKNVFDNEFWLADTLERLQLTGRIRRYLVGDSILVVREPVNQKWGVELPAEPDDIKVNEEMSLENRRLIASYQRKTIDYLVEQGTLDGILLAYTVSLLYFGDDFETRDDLRLKIDELFQKNPDKLTVGELKNCQRRYSQLLVVDMMTREEIKYG